MQASWVLKFLHAQLFKYVQLHRLIMCIDDSCYGIDPIVAQHRLCLQDVWLGQWPSMLTKIEQIAQSKKS